MANKLQKVRFFKRICKHLLYLGNQKAKIKLFPDPQQKGYLPDWIRTKMMPLWLDPNQRMPGWLHGSEPKWCPYDWIRTKWCLADWGSGSMGEEKSLSLWLLENYFVHVCCNCCCVEISHALEHLSSLSVCNLIRMLHLIQLNSQLGHKGTV